MTYKVHYRAVDRRGPLVFQLYCETPEALICTCAMQHEILASSRGYDQDVEIMAVDGGAADRTVLSSRLEASAQFYSSEGNCSNGLVIS